MFEKVKNLEYSLKPTDSRVHRSKRPKRASNVKKTKHKKLIFDCRTSNFRKGKAVADC